MIETTSGYIFGGFSRAFWSSSYNYISDSSAFLFSLVNKFKRPFKCKISKTGFAIHCKSDNGPKFGTSDISIADKCNTSKNNKAVRDCFEKPFGIDDPNEFYFCDGESFQVKELEVFKYVE